MTNHLRTISKRRIGGIVIPFGVLDTYRTMFGRSTDFLMEMYTKRPFLVYHNLSKQRLAKLTGDVPQVVRGKGVLWAGEISNENVEIRDGGVYVEAETFDHAVGDYAHELVNQRVAAASTQAAPTLIDIGPDGFVKTWGWVEASVLHYKDASSPGGTTTLSEIRAFLPDSDLQDDELQRSIWIMPGNGQDDVQAPVDGNQVILDAIGVLSTAVGGIGERMDALEVEPATRGLDGGAGLDLGETEPRIVVGSIYDDVSALGLVVNHMACGARAKRVGFQYEPKEEFMRALGVKVSKIRDVQTEEEDPFARNPLRAIDYPAYKAWHENGMPYFRADELWQATLAGSGDELVPTLMSSLVWWHFSLESRVFGLFDKFMMPSNPFDYPVITALPTIDRVLEPTDRSQMTDATSVYEESQATTADNQFNAGKIGAVWFASQDLFEDSGVATADVMAQAMLKAMTKAIDDVLINGDETNSSANISGQGVVPAGGDRKYLILDGLRHEALITTTADKLDNTTLATGDMLTLQQLMGARGIIGTDVQNLAMIVDPGSYFKIAGFSDFYTVDKIGTELAIILKGQIGSWNGVPLIVSDEVKDTNSSGAIGASSNDFGSQILMHRKTPLLGLMRDIEIDHETRIFQDSIGMVARARLDMKFMEAGGSAVGYHSTI